MKPTLLSVIQIAVLCCACSSLGSHASTSVKNQLSEDDRHRLYSAALAASESPLDTDSFKDVCQKIGIFDASGNPNDQYMTFVSRHVDWGTRPETNQFRQEINSKEKAREYIREHLSAQ